MKGVGNVPHARTSWQTAGRGATAHTTVGCTADEPGQIGQATFFQDHCVALAKTPKRIRNGVLYVYFKIGLA